MWTQHQKHRQTGVHTFPHALTPAIHLIHVRVSLAFRAQGRKIRTSLYPFSDRHPLSPPRCRPSPPYASFDTQSRWAFRSSPPTPPPCPEEGRNESRLNGAVALVDVSTPPHRSRAKTHWARNPHPLRHDPATPHAKRPPHQRSPRLPCCAAAFFMCEDFLRGTGRGGGPTPSRARPASNPPPRPPPACPFLLSPGTPRPHASCPTPNHSQDTPMPKYPHGTCFPRGPPRTIAAHTVALSALPARASPPTPNPIVLTPRPTHSTCQRTPPHPAKGWDPPPWTRMTYPTHNPPTLSRPVVYHRPRIPRERPSTPSLTPPPRSVICHKHDNFGDSWEKWRRRTPPHDSLDPQHVRGPPRPLTRTLYAIGPPPQSTLYIVYSKTPQPYRGPKRTQLMLSSSHRPLFPHNIRRHRLFHKQTARRIRPLPPIPLPPHTSPPHDPPPPFTPTCGALRPALAPQ